MAAADVNRLITFSWSELMFAATNYFGQQKAPTHARRGGKTVVLLLIFPKLMMLGLELAPVIET